MSALRLSPGAIAGLFAALCACSSQPDLPPPTAQPEGLPTTREPVSEAASPPGVEGASIPCFGPDVTFKVRGEVRSPDGGVPNQPIGVRQADGSFVEQTRTDADGVYELTVRGPVVYTVTSAVSEPGEACSFSEQQRADPALAPLLEGVIARGATFQIGRRCSLNVEVVGPDGAPVADAQVLGNFAEGRTNTFGRLTLPDAPCGRVMIAARAPDGRSLGDESTLNGAPQEACFKLLDPESTCLQLEPAATPPTVVLHLAETRDITGKVTDANGAPIVGATVSNLLEMAHTDAEGRYTLQLYAGLKRPVVLTAAAKGYADNNSGLIAAGYEHQDSLRKLGDEVWIRDFVLEPVRAVEVRCLGLAAEECDRLYLTCSSPSDGAKERPRRCDLATPRLCPCKVEGQVLIHGGGLTVAVEAGQDLAWLDFRAYTGGVRGTVTGLDACEVSAVFDRPWHFDMLAGSSREIACAPDGSFALEHLPPGDWTITASERAPLDGHLLRARASRTARVAAETVEMGSFAIEE